MMDAEIARLEEELERKRLEAQIHALESQLQAKGVLQRDSPIRYSHFEEAEGDGQCHGDEDEEYYEGSEVEYEEEVEYVDEHGNPYYDTGAMEEYVVEDEEVVYDDDDGYYEPQEGNEEYYDDDDVYGDEEIVEEYEEEVEGDYDDDNISDGDVDEGAPASASAPPSPRRATTAPATWPPTKEQATAKVAVASEVLPTNSTWPPTSSVAKTTPTPSSTPSTVSKSPFGVTLKKVGAPSAPHSSITSVSNLEVPPPVAVKSYTARNPPPPSSSGGRRTVVSGSVMMPSHSAQAQSNKAATTTASPPKKKLVRRVVVKKPVAVAPEGIEADATVPVEASPPPSTAATGTKERKGLRGFFGGRNKAKNEDVPSATTTTPPKSDASPPVPEGASPLLRKKVVRRVVVKKIGAGQTVPSSSETPTLPPASDPTATAASPPRRAVTSGNIAARPKPSSTTATMVGSIVKPPIKKFTPEVKAANAAAAAEAAAQVVFRPRRINTGIHPSQEGYENFWECCLGPRQIMNCRTMNKCSTNAALTGMDLVILYFGAKWKPECRQFSKHLIDFYKTCCVPNRVECIYISADRSLLEFKDVFKDMPFLAMPSGTSDLKNFLTETLKVLDTPACVVLNVNKATVVTTDAVQQITNLKAGDRVLADQLVTQWKNRQGIPLQSVQLGSNTIAGTMMEKGAVYWNAN